MSNYPKIWFLRHGQTFWNAERRIQGRLNSNLTEQGIKDAYVQQRLMAPFIDQAIADGAGLYVSPQGRAQQTAEIALNGRPFKTDPRLAEINTGTWEGRLRDEVAPDGTSLDVYANAPGGEGYEGLQARVSAFLDDLKHPAIIVSHGILGQILRGQVCGLSREETSALTNLQGCIYVLEGGRETLLEDS